MPFSDPRFGETKTEPSLQHIPPHSLEAERSVLGALLLDGNAYSKVVDVGLEPIDFYRDWETPY